MERPKIVVVLRDDLLPWQELNVTAFVTSGVVAEHPELIGEPYRDGDGAGYAAMLGYPVMVMTASGELLGTVRRRAADRGVPISVYTADLFGTGNDVDNRAAVAAVATGSLDLVGVALAAERNDVDRIVKGAKLHA